eukprot:1001914-Pelagomonas_calceolata.AAC.1
MQSPCLQFQNFVASVLYTCISGTSTRSRPISIPQVAKLLSTARGSSTLLFIGTARKQTGLWFVQQICTYLVMPLHLMPIPSYPPASLLQHLLSSQIVTLAPSYSNIFAPF